MASKGKNWRVLHSAIGTGFSMYREGDVVAPEHMQHGEGKDAVKWDTERLERIGAIERTDDEPTVVRGYEFSPPPDALRVRNLEVEGEPDNAAQPTDEELANMAEANEKRLDGASQRATAEGHDESAHKGRTAKQAADTNRADAEKDK